MKLGFITSCFPGLTLEEVVGWASATGFEALEVAAWPTDGNRPFTASHLDADQLSESQATKVSKLLADHGMEIASVSYYDNNLHPDPGTRKAINRYVSRCIEAAALVGSPTVGTFVGRDPTKSVKENLKEAEAIFAPLVEQAQSAGVKIVIENCVMEGWHPDGYPGNLAYSPELWEWMFSIGLFLN
ncbi:MAG: sugar phosphate isomerase/epimerase family protein, partial [Acidimicrobiia bacterium]